MGAKKATIGFQLFDHDCSRTRYTGAMRQPVKLVGPGVSPEEVAAVFGITPERQAFIRELLRPYREANARQNGAKTKRTGRKAAGKKSASRK